MSDLDLWLGRRFGEEVDALRQSNGRWPLRVDGGIAHGAWDHILQGMLAKGHRGHSDPAWRPGLVEAVGSGLCISPEQLICNWVHHADAEHRNLYLLENLDAQGIAVYSQCIDCRQRYYIIAVWRAHHSWG